MKYYIFTLFSIAFISYVGTQGTQEMQHFLNHTIISFDWLLNGDTHSSLEYYPVGWILEYHPTGWIILKYEVSITIYNQWNEIIMCFKLFYCRDAEPLLATLCYDQDFQHGLGLLTQTQGPQKEIIKNLVSFLLEKSVHSLFNFTLFCFYNNTFIYCHIMHERSLWTVRHMRISCCTSNPFHYG